MRLVADHTAGAAAVRVNCLKCGKQRRLADMIADADGPAFMAYYCDKECADAPPGWPIWQCSLDGCTRCT